MRSLRVRVPLLAMAVLAASLTIAALIAHTLLVSAGYARLDDVLEREQRGFQQSIANIIERADARRDPPRERLERAVREYLRSTPRTEAYMTVVRLRGEILTSPRGPRLLRALERAGRIPASAPLRLETVPSVAGDMRSLATPVAIGGDQVAVFQVLGPVDRIHAEGRAALERLAHAALISLLVGGAVLFLALRRSLVPLRDLAATARDTQLERLSSRVPEDDRGDEVGELAGEFNRMLERLERAAASNREFMAAVSHELRTPITIARGHIETLEAIGLDDRAAVEEVTTVVREELLHMGRLVADLMALARSESEDFIQPGRVELPALFAELRLRLAGLSLEDVTVGEAPDVAFAADADRLAQALLNLVVNADVHTPAGTAVHVDAVLETGAVVFTVGDDGPGMDSSVRHEAFRPFVTSGTVHGSTGLGLAVVRAVAEGHGGSVGLETGPEGTTVTLRVPALVATAHSAAPAAAS